MDTLNHLDDVCFVNALAPVFENAPWVAERALAGRPYASLDELHAMMMRAVHERPLDARIDFLCGHPDLAGKAARARQMTDASITEQSSVGLDRLSEEEFLRFDRSNTAYRERFGFPFIVCVRNYTKTEILELFDARLRNDRDTEVARALVEVADITRGRLNALAARLVSPDAVHADTHPCRRTP